MARDAGLPGLHFAGVRGANKGWDPTMHGFDSTISPRVPARRPWISWRDPIRKLRFRIQELRGLPTIYNYQEIVDELIVASVDGKIDFPCVVPNWDNTPRSDKNGLVLHNSTPEHFRSHFKKAIAIAERLPEGHKIIFVKSWNEWAEGNHLEPDMRYGTGYLEVIREELGSFTHP